MSVNILLHNSATVIVLSTGRIVHGTICLERNYIKSDEDSVFTRNHAEFLIVVFDWSVIQTFVKTRPRHRHALKLKFGGKFEKKILQKYCAVAFFFLYGNKNVPSDKILRERRCLRTRTFILFEIYNNAPTFSWINVT